jgi:hypothetical protein
MGFKHFVRRIEKALARIDWKKHDAAVIWSLNAPNCLCCDLNYQIWLNWGRNLFGEKDPFYKRRVSEEEFHI